MAPHKVVLQITDGGVRYSVEIFDQTKPDHNRKSAKAGVVLADCTSQDAAATARDEFERIIAGIMRRVLTPITVVTEHEAVVAVWRATTTLVRGHDYVVNTEAEEEEAEMR